MKQISIILVAIFSMIVLVQEPVLSQTQKKEEKKEVKLTIEQKIDILTKELNLNKQEQLAAKKILVDTQNYKKKIKDLDLPKKEEKKKIETIKDNQKNKLKRLLGSNRYAKYTQLKKKNVL
jgi:hypothetical protein